MILKLKHNSKHYLSIGINKRDDTGVIRFILIPYFTKSEWASVRIKEVYYLLFYFAICTEK